MAERRMFTQKIVDSDAFLDMPLSTQALYFHLNMRADDDGFINNPRKVQRMIGASDDDLKLLIAKRFVLTFENGVIVIKHWRMHNLLRKDRYTPTQYQEQMASIELKANGSYTEKGSEALEIACFDNVATNWQPNGNQMATQDSIGKDSIVKDSVEKKSIKEKVTYVPDEELNTAILSFIENRKKLKKPMTDRAIELMLKHLFEMSQDADEQIAILNQSIEGGWTNIYPLKKEKNNKRVSTQQSAIDMWASFEGV